LKKGLTVFVLKYRTGRTISNDPWQETLNNLKDTSKRQKLETIRTLAMADVFAAIRYVRTQATELGIEPTKIGVVGFSAGGTLALGLCTTGETAFRPDFVGLIYSVYRAAPNNTIPATAPPAFIACATDDVLASPANSIALYSAWLQAKRPAELHIYVKGGHGLRGNISASNWLMRFEEWMETIGMMK
jgi:acetyl esterase/lipase